MDPQAQALSRALTAVIAACAAVPDHALTDAERRLAGGRCFAEGDEIINLVARALRLDPDLFPDVAVDPAALLAGKARARGYRLLAGVLGELARRARDAYLVEQSAAVGEALSVVEQVRATGAQPHPFPGQERREEALWRVEAVLARRQRDKRRAAGRNAQRRKGPAQPGS